MRLEERRWPGRDGDEYDRAFREREAGGHDVHGEATMVAGLDPRSVLDAGCGTGRVAIELARRGIDVVGVDLDPAMLAAARRKAPELDWRLGDLATVTVSAQPGEPPRQFDVVVAAGNVMIFVAPGTEAAVIANLARHLAPGGCLVSGFQLVRGRISLTDYDTCAGAAGLELVRRLATWDGQPHREGGDYVVAIHRARE